MNIAQYVSRMRGLFYTHCLSIIECRATPPNIRTASGQDSTILLIDASFSDHSTLQAVEELIEDQGNIRKVGYSYAYQRPSGFFFHYEMEQTPEQTTTGRLRKPHNHLHVGAVKEVVDCLENFPPQLREHDGPHFGTPFVALDGVLATIIVNYFHQGEEILDKLDLNQC